MKIIIGQASELRTGARHTGPGCQEDLRGCCKRPQKLPRARQPHKEGFPVGKARRAARRLSGRLRGRAGNRVGAAFDVRAVWDAQDAGLEVAAIPHPSGINRKRFTKFARLA